ncbi:MAG: AEC family transporter [Gammaproteobacteria bacterium]|nr:MAG: AEC family transporter [Gammaproteobacteria bacterium]RLA23539.1 MAG: AEC family transporter [Gammaproteobacteria bacterium]
MIFRVLEITLPIFTIILIGYLYARVRHLEMEEPNKLNFEVFIPALLFFVLSEKIPQDFQFGGLALGGTIVVLGSGLLLLPVSRLLGFSPTAFLPSMMFNNSGNLGLPLAVFAFGESMFPAAVVLFVVMVCFQHTLGTLMLEGKVNLQVFIRNPIFIATGLGILANQTDWHLPAIMLPAVDMLGQVAIPMMLIALGVRLTSIKLDHWKMGIWGALLCPLSGIICALLAIIFIDLPKEQAGLLVLFGALPPAVMNAIMAERYNREPELVASIVAVGNLLSLAVIPLTLLFIID